MQRSREELWVAMSDLWLDTELSEDRLDEIATVVRDSGLSREELEAVFETELAPFLGLNGLTVAGVWDGFDPDWVCQQARRHSRRSLFARFLAKLGVTTYGARPAWNKVMALAFSREAH
ncbi:MAG: hypothetical protein ETSY1_20500 [Candidatus Entotheonella factor]|uniref:DUF7079 domain-containing protein n=1 Tax=Entotheonella factor TaxID=1429438 RepID=W4LKY8_ENTF1|nr:hypothetical protein [Candidatus Entotheonella palauensis]ETW98011.1 MAG: hypothetical protein ETSY1_20500 [Candidatus Entotheonella factor]